MQFEMFAQNKSTKDEWFVTHKGLIPVKVLDRSHVETIIKMYEDEAVKIITFTLGPSPLQAFRQKNSLTVQAFLRRNVNAWTALKNREAEFKKSDEEKNLAKGQEVMGYFNRYIRVPVEYSPNLSMKFPSIESNYHRVVREISRIQKELDALKKQLI